MRQPWRKPLEALEEKLDACEARLAKFERWVTDMFDRQVRQ